jgi:hypothetical protein
VGLVVDRHGGAWGQPLVSLWVWLLFGVLMFQAAALRLRLLACLLIATAGEVVLSWFGGCTTIAWATCPCSCRRGMCSFTGWACSGPGACPDG